MWKYNGSTDFFAEQVIADSIEENESNAEADQRVTHYTHEELLKKLRESKHRSSRNPNCQELTNLGQEINAKKSVSTVYYPYCGADVGHVFLLFPYCTTMIGFGRDDFGGLEDLNYYNENNDFTSVPLFYANGFDSHKYHEAQSYKYPDSKYKVCPDVLLRITQILGGEILSVEKTKVGEGKDDFIYYINFMLNDLQRTFIYAKYEVNCNSFLPTPNSPVRDYLISQSPDALLLKAIPDVLLTYEDGLTLALASVSQEEQIVLSDARTYNWDKSFQQKDEPQPVFLRNARLDSVHLNSSFGYGTTLFIGNGSQLRQIYHVERELEQTLLDAEVEPAIMTTTKEQIDKSEPTIIAQNDAPKAPQNPKDESNKKNSKSTSVEQAKTSSAKSSFNIHHLKLFTPVKELYKKLNKSKEQSKQELESTQVDNSNPTPSLFE
ncbi:hypothetical protein [Legionella maioricensis]|uniref:Uncharacterized protein n=1 Tax=Legionella maioricensis TaxID=2896528 RepID=A0A9X2CXF5_9GAMM|nr:hypothetical protein [Legionella maioricensis]MCL9682570.1 hypothetical protein [Legionella maioricensis]MCL9686183.1 hypothetical protein [Legionella maioricensis]